MAKIAGGYYPSKSYQANSVSKSDTAKGASRALTQNAFQSNTTHQNSKQVTKSGNTYSVVIDKRPSTANISDKASLRLDAPHMYKGEELGTHINANPKLATNKMQQTTLGALNHSEISQPIYNAFKDFDKVGRNAKVGGAAFAAAAVVVDSKDIYESYKSDGNKVGKNTVTTSAGVAASWSGAIGGARVGAMGGAALGTLICPGLGTAVGGVIGGLGGGILGSYAGRTAGESVAKAAWSWGE